MEVLMQRGDNPPHPARDTRQQMNSAAADEQVMVFPGELIGEMIAFCLPQKLLPVLPIPFGVQKSVHGAYPLSNLRQRASSPSTGVGIGVLGMSGWSGWFPARLYLSL